MEDSHAGLLMFELIIQVLEGLLGSWRHVKLICTAADRVRNVTARLRGAFSRFEEECLPGFYLIWCANHQLDLVVQGVMNAVMKQSFRLPLFSVIYICGNKPLCALTLDPRVLL